MTAPNLVVASMFRSIADAQVAQGLLDGAGIESMVSTDDVGGMYPGVGGAVLMVRPEDVETATEVLSSLQERDADGEDDVE